MRDGWLQEHMVAEMLGVSVPRVKELRPDLERGEDWELEDGHIVYSQSGVEELLMLLGVTEAPPPVVLPENPPQVKEAQVDARMPHERGTLEGSGETVAVPPAAAGDAGSGEKTPPRKIQVWVVGPAGNRRWLVCGPVENGVRTRTRKLFVRMAGRIRAVPKCTILDVSVAKDGVLEYVRGGVR
jgi:hypothetical protein